MFYRINTFFLLCMNNIDIIYCSYIIFTRTLLKRKSETLTVDLFIFEITAVGHEIKLVLV